MLIGLTGGIGSGKSTIARELKARGYQVYDADLEAKRLIVQQPDVRQALIRLLGDDIFEGDRYRTDIVAGRVFQDASLLQGLNAIVHPALKTDLQAWAKGQALCFAEAAVLYESGLDSICDGVAAVIASKQVRLQRTIARDSASEEQVKARMKAQISNCQLRSRADYIVENNGKIPVERLVDKLLKQLSKHKRL